MGQAEVLKVLKDKKDPLSADDIAKLCNSNKNPVMRALRTMERFNEVEREVAFKNCNWSYSSKCERKVYVWRIKE